MSDSSENNPRPIPRRGDARIALTAIFMIGSEGDNPHDIFRIQRTATMRTPRGCLGTHPFTLSLSNGQNPSRPNVFNAHLSALPTNLTKTYIRTTLAADHRTHVLAPSPERESQVPVKEKPRNVPKCPGMSLKFGRFADIPLASPAGTARTQRGNNKKEFRNVPKCPGMSLKFGRFADIPLASPAGTARTQRFNYKKDATNVGIAPSLS